MIQIESVLSFIESREDKKMFDSWTLSFGDDHNFHFRFFANDYTLKEHIESKDFMDLFPVYLTFKEEVYTREGFPASSSFSRVHNLSNLGIMLR